jgi:NADH-quinone oxidoreductase subunit L
LILESAYSAKDSVGYMVFILGIIAAFFTACYSMKIIISVFHGNSKLSQEELVHIHEAPDIMLMPLTVLTIGAIFAGMYGDIGLHIGDEGGYLSTSILQPATRTHHINWDIRVMPLMIGSVGIVYTSIIYKTKIATSLTSGLKWVRSVLHNKYYFDEIYHASFVQTTNILSKLCALFDRCVIDYFGPSASVRMLRYFTCFTKKIQSGYIFNYASYMLFGVIVAMSWYLVSYINQIYQFPW